MSNAVLPILAHYDLREPFTTFVIPSGSNNYIIGIHSGDGDFALKTIGAPHDLAALRHEQTLLGWLAEQALSFAVPAPLPTRQGDPILQTAEGYHILMPLLPGQKPDWQEPTQIELVGAALGELHPVLIRYPHSVDHALPPYGALGLIHPALPNPYDLTAAQLNLVPTTAVDEWLVWWRAELALLRAFVEGAYRSLPQQLIHSDFGHSNTLFLHDDRGGHISAILDFEFAGPDARVMDLASALYFCTRLWENPAPLVNAVSFCRGYGSQQRLTPAEIAAIPWLMRLRNAASAIWWLGRQLTAGDSINMAERMTDMRHFVTWLDGEEGKAFTQILLDSMNGN